MGLRNRHRKGRERLRARVERTPGAIGVDHKGGDDDGRADPVAEGSELEGVSSMEGDAVHQHIASLANSRSQRAVVLPVQVYHLNAQVRRPRQARSHTPAGGADAPSVLSQPLHRGATDLPGRA